MGQREDVIKVMRENGGFATLGFLYRNVDVTGWGTKTPDASIRRIVQNENYFYKIKPGLWALNEQKEGVEKKLNLKEEEKFNHSYYQGLITELGSMKGFKTFVPNQDKRKRFLNKNLNDVSTLKDVYPFTYDKIVRRASNIDVIWFNEFKFPRSFFEVEYSTSMYNSLLKFNELRFFCAEFNIVSFEHRKREFEDKIQESAFSEIRKRVNFLNFDKVADWHTKASEFYLLEKTVYESR